MESLVSWICRYKSKEIFLGFPDDGCLTRLEFKGKKWVFLNIGFLLNHRVNMEARDSKTKPDTVMVYGRDADCVGRFLNPTCS